MPVRPPSLRSIAAFDAAARHASFTRAADDLNLTPGAISHAIRALEERLGQQLFLRTGRAVTLTPAGQTLAARVRLSLGLLTDAFDITTGRAADRIVVSTMHSIAGKILGPHLARLRDSLAGARLDIRCTESLATFDDGIDLAIRFGPGGWRGLQSRLLGPEQLFPVAGRDYRGRRVPRCEAELGEHVLIHHPESSWRLWLESSELDPTRFGNAFYVDSAAMVLEAAAAGVGIGLARARLAAGDLASGRLVRLLDRAVPAEYSYWAVWNGSSPKLSLIAAFVDAVGEIFDGPLASAASGEQP
jgi:LysR family glycine cleavage system transcriptional activator